MDAIAHAGRHLYVTVIDGEISTRITGEPGDDTIPLEVPSPPDPGEYLEVGNASVDDARIIATVLLPKGAPLMTIAQAGSSSAPDMNTSTPPLFPTTVYQASTEVERPAGAFELVHLLLDLDPGVSTPRHMHGGQEFSVVVGGNVTLQRSDNSQVFGAGESWVNPSGLVHAAGNDGPDLAQVVVTFLLPAGGPLTTSSNSTVKGAGLTARAGTEAGQMSSAVKRCPDKIHSGSMRFRSCWGSN